MADPPTNSDFGPTARWEMLRFRSDTLRRLRQFFEQRGFVEVETPLLSHDSVVDLHLDPIPVAYFDDPRHPTQTKPMWLQTSPEFGMKRLLSAGADKIFQITKAFRAGERGAWHNPEFTMVEWYRVGDDYLAGMNLLADFAQELLGVQAVERLTYREAFLRFARVDPFRASPAELTAAAERAQLHPPAALAGRDEWLNFLLASCVEPNLGKAVPCIVSDYPATQAALARTRPLPGEPELAVAERFELYFRGMELANGYHELLDASVLRERNRIANQQRQRDGRYLVPAESRLLTAMEQGLPPCSGVALGFDRLVMQLTGAQDIRDVIAFPIDRA